MLRAHHGEPTGMSDKPKLDIINRETLAAQDAVDYLRAKADELAGDETVLGVIVVVETATGYTLGGSYSTDLVRRVGLLEMAKQQVLDSMMPGPGAAVE